MESAAHMVLTFEHGRSLLALTEQHVIAALTAPSQMLRVHGPWGAKGLKTFTRRRKCIDWQSGMHEDEAAASMVFRINEDARLVAEAAAELAAAVASTSYTTPNASPASQRSTRSHGESGKPSPASSAGMEPPSRPKRQQRAPLRAASPPPATRGAKQQLAASGQLMLPPPPPNARLSGTGWIGRRQLAATATAKPPSAAARRSTSNPERKGPMEPDVELRPPSAWSSGSGWIGRKQQLLAAAAASAKSKLAASTPSRDSASRMDDDFPMLGAATMSKPDLMGAAISAANALAYRSPQTDPQQRSAAPPALTRSGVAKGRGELQLTMEQRLVALKPRGRVQRHVQLSPDERRALDADRKRRSRTEARQLSENAAAFMAELGRYDLPLVQLQISELMLVLRYGVLKFVGLPTMLGIGDESVGAFKPDGLPRHRLWSDLGPAVTKSLFTDGAMIGV